MDNNDELERTVAQMLAPVGCALDEVLGLEKLRERRGTGCVFLGGSLSEHLGNAGSDVDMYVIGDLGPAAPNYHRIEGMPVAVHMLRGRRVAFTYLDDRKIEDVAQRLLALNYVERGTDNIPLENRLSEEDTVIAHRIRSGSPVWNPGLLQDKRDLFDFEGLARYLMVLSIRVLWHVNEDLEGMADAGDRDVAIAMSRLVLDAALDAYLHQLGNTNVRRKWRLKLLARAPSTEFGADLIDRYWSLAYPDVAPLRRKQSRLAAHARSCLDFANDVTRWIDGRYAAAQ